MPKPRRRVEPIDGVRYIGIDPGKSGGIAILDQHRVGYYVMPETERDIWELISAYSRGNVRAVIEKVSSSPQMGVTSAFTFGRGYGTLLAFLTAAGIPHEEIRPQVWQKALHIPPRKREGKNRKAENTKSFKNRLKVKAQQIFPDLPIWSEPKSKGRQLAICDALLIAEFAKRTAR